MKRNNLLIIALFLILGIFFSSNVSQAASKVTQTVQTARKVYYYVEDNKYKMKKIKSSYVTDYYDSRNRLRLTVARSSKRPYCVYGITSEFYYDTKHNLVFAFGYKRSNGKTYEYRAYYNKNRLYRYIGSDKKVRNYPSGKTYKYMPTYAKKMKFASDANLHYLGFD